MNPDPRQTPFGKRSLTAAAGSSNSRFFTDCYHEAAVFAPLGCRKSGPDPKLVALAARWNPPLRLAPDFPDPPSIVIYFQPVTWQPARLRGDCRRHMETARTGQGA